MKEKCISMSIDRTCVVLFDSHLVYFKGGMAGESIDNKYYMKAKYGPALVSISSVIGHLHEVRMLHQDVSVLRCQSVTVPERI